MGKQQLGLRQCPECYGFGFWNYQNSEDEQDLETCQTCAGSGVWIPYEHKSGWVGEIAVINGPDFVTKRRQRLYQNLCSTIMSLSETDEFPWDVYFGRETA